jgi:Raf kinase inhibitor-like YbhB/YbcL family protein
VASWHLNLFCIVVALGLTCLTPENLFSQSGGKPMSFTISSTAFTNGGDIPKKFTCDGADVSPPLSWTDAPAKTGAFAIIADDPDAPAGIWTHWLIYDLPANRTELEENVIKADRLPNGSHQGRNDFRKLGYGGPCPPAGTPHRYVFKIYALDSKLNLAPGSTKQELEQAMQGHVLAKGELIGKYGR